MDKLTKIAVHYTDRATGSDHCGICKHFQVEAPRHCEVVQGIIEPAGWCDRFKRKSVMVETIEKNRSNR